MSDENDNGLSFTSGKSSNTDYWRGTVQTNLRFLRDAISHIERKVEKIDTAMEDIKTTITRLVVVSGICTFIGGAVVTVVVGIIFKWLIGRA